jgi:hypothetical protein
MTISGPDEPLSWKKTDIAYERNQCGKWYFRQ